MMQESGKRKYPRIPVAVEVRCGDKLKPLTYVSRDLSIGGVFVESAQVFPLGADVELATKLPYAYGDLKLKGKVVRHNQDTLTGLIDGMAIEFSTLTETEKKILTDYIKNTVERKTP